MLETTTSGLQYQYRVIVTDSDTAGLFIYDTSTPVYLVINPRIQISGSYTVQKYGATHTDTFTAVSSTGTGNKIFTVSPNNRSGITWNVATANQATVTIAGSVGPGTYYDTMTATDTKGAQTQLSVAIVVNKADTITVTATAITTTYTGSTLTFTPGYLVTGLVNSDTVTSITYEYQGTSGNYARSATKPTNAGAYATIPIPVISNSDSYTAVSIVPRALTVNRATRNITIDTLTSTLKYGSSALLSATISAGAGDGTLTFSTAQTDSCTVAAANLQAVKSSGTCVISAVISQGANYETATATTKTVALAKADTITVQVRNPVTTVYSPAGPSSLPTLAISGLVLSDTATTSRLYSAPASGTTCATGGLCSVGDTGPGGGKVFYDAGSNQSWGRYLEAAPANWTGTSDSETAYIGAWCVVNGVAMTNAASIVGTVNGIGQGKINTYLSALDQCTGGAIYRARQYRGGGLSDWYLPSSDELLVMGSNTSPNFIRNSIGMVYSAALYGYWGSDLGSPTGTVRSLVTVNSAWSTGYTNRNDLIHNMLRPIRAFAPSASSIYSAVVNSSSVPIDVETYTVSAATLNFTVGSLTDYQNIVYETSTLTITQANQTALGINLYGAVAGSSYPLVVSGGSGDGALIYLVDGTGTGTNCAVSNGALSNSNSALEQTSCSITITKAASRNYKAQSLSATVYFIAYVVSQPAPAPGSGSGIALPGRTAYEVVTTAPPTITLLSSSTISRASTGKFTITGTGFNAADLLVTFYHDASITPAPSSVTATTIELNIADIVAAGATNGRITVSTVNGPFTSPQFVTFTP